MSSTFEIRQTCPECQGTIVVKNRELVGKKVTCPRCKKAVLVQDNASGKKSANMVKPVQQASQKEKPGGGNKASKTSSDNNRVRMLIFIGAGLLVVVGVVLIVFLLMSGGSKSQDQAQNNGGGQRGDMNPPIMPGGGPPGDVQKPPVGEPGRTRNPAEQLERLLHAQGQEAQKLRMQLAQELLRGQGQQRQESLKLFREKAQELAKKNQDLTPILQVLELAVRNARTSAELRRELVETISAVRRTQIAQLGDWRTHATNLLPYETQIFLHLPIERLLKSFAQQVIFDQAGFQPQDFEQQLGVELGHVADIVVAGLPTREQCMIIVTTKVPIVWERVQSVLHVRPETRQTRAGKEFYSGRARFLNELLGDRFPLASLSQKAAVHLDSSRKILVIAHEELLSSWLEKPPAVQWRVGSSEGTKEAGGAPVADFATFLTLPRDFRLLVDRVEREGPYALLYGEWRTQKQSNQLLAGLKAWLQWLPGELNFATRELVQADGLALALVQLPDAPLALGLAIHAPQPSSAERIKNTVLRINLPAIRETLAKALDTNVLVRDLDKETLLDTSAGSGGGGYGPGGEGQVPGGFPGAGPGSGPAGPMPPGGGDSDVGPGGGIKPIPPNVGGGSLPGGPGPKPGGGIAPFPPNAGGGPPGGGSAPGGPGPGGGIAPFPPNAGGGPPGGGGSAPGGPGPGPGGGIKPFPPNIGGGVVPGGPGIQPIKPNIGGGGSAPGEAFQPPGGIPSPEPGQTQPPGSNEPVTIDPNKPILSISVQQMDEYVQIQVMLTEPSKPLLQALEEELIYARGEMQLHSRGFRVHDLAQAASAYPSNNSRTFPPGALIARDEAYGSPGNLFLADRVSFFRELLPYLDDDRYRQLHSQIDPAKPWHDPHNLKAARILVPHFLHPGAGPHYGVVSSDSGQVRVALTHFVGMAGVGPDAMFYRKDDPRAGIFGDPAFRGPTTLDDIRDGTSTTILLIQVDSQLAGPWIQGGGSTMRGTSWQGNDVGRPYGFLAPPHGGKPGTFVVMADGSVRFVTRSIAPDVFKALCTMAGGERLPPFDSVAPPVQRLEASPSSGKPVEKTKPVPKTPPISQRDPFVPDPALLSQLGAETSLGPFAFRPPAGYKGEKGKPTAQGEISATWIGPLREEVGVSPALMVSLTPLDLSLAGEPLDVITRKMVARLPSDGGRWEFDATIHRGLVHGLLFARVAARFVTKEGEQLRGYYYQHTDGKLGLGILILDHPAYADRSLPLLETSVATFRKQ